MSYLVLARKWRPQTFAEVVGQDAVTLTLKNALTSGRIAHAYLLTGSRGVGKTTIARILAKCLVCENRVASEPCNQCSQCLSITNSTSLDVIEIDGASHTSVDDIRTLREGARFLPTSARLKVFIIDEVHMLSTNAFNALLKILEEPPAHVKFIFATTEAHKIPPTILSRCQRFDFGRVSTNAIVEHLQKILVSENITIAESSLRIIAKAAQGGMRDALSLLDQIISFSAHSPSDEEVSTLLGLTPRTLITELLDAILSHDTNKALQFLTNIHQKGHDLALLMEDLATELRHLLIVSVAGTAPNALADLSSDELRTIAEKASSYQTQDLQRLFTWALEGIASVAKAYNPVLSAELVIIKMAHRALLHEMQSIAEAISRLERLENQTNTLPYKEGKTTVPPSEPHKNKGPTLPPLAAKTLKDIDQTWLSFVKAVSEKHVLLGSHLEHGHFLGIRAREKGQEIEVEFHYRVHYHAVNDSGTLLQPFLSSAFGPDAALKLSLKSVTAAPQATNISDAREEEKRLEMEALTKRAYSDPVVQKAIELFGGEVISVSKTPEKPKS